MRSYTFRADFTDTDPASKAVVALRGENKTILEAITTIVSALADISVVVLTISDYSFQINNSTENKQCHLPHNSKSTCDERDLCAFTVP